MFAEAPSSRFAPSVSDAPGNERRSSPPIPDDKRTRASLAHQVEAEPASRPISVILLEAVGRAVLIAGAALVAATLLSVALGVGADAAVLVEAAR